MTKKKKIEAIKAKIVKKVNIKAFLIKAFSVKVLLLNNKAFLIK